MQPVEGAVIACAGLGSRLGMGLPKCMIEVDGRTILSRLVRTLRSLVPSIRVVVGYREEMVIEYCSRYYRDVLIVRNPDFRKTNTSHSLRLGSIGIERKMLCLDGDLIISASSLEQFITRAMGVPLLVGMTKAKSSNPVFVRTEFDASKLGSTITGFDRGTEAAYEWANVFAGSPEVLKPGSGYVFESLAAHLPAAACALELFEVDTAADLVRATNGIASLESANGG